MQLESHTAHHSICVTCDVVSDQGMTNEGGSCPEKRTPSWVSLTSTRRTSSPRYRPLNDFSKLEWGRRGGREHDFKVRYYIETNPNLRTARNTGACTHTHMHACTHTRTHMHTHTQCTKRSAPLLPTVSSHHKQKNVV